MIIFFVDIIDKGEANMSGILESAEQRRSIYNLGNNVSISKKKIINLVENAVKYCPTAFNSQSARVVILFAEEYQKFWNIVEDKVKSLNIGKDFSKTKSKLDTFRQGVGTILFFEDRDVIKKLQSEYPLYKDKFEIWSNQANGMLQYIIWTALSENNIGASLQHYNPLIDTEVINVWNIPNNWCLIAQMPFGSVEKVAAEKTFEPIKNRVKIFG